MKKFAAILAAMLLAILAVVPMVGASADAAVMYVSTQGGPLNVRSSKDINSYNVMDQLKNGTEVKVLSTTGSWAYIQFSRTGTGATANGYVAKKYLSTTLRSSDAVTAVTPCTVTVHPVSKTGFVNMRVAASKASTSIGQYRTGAALTMTACSSTWAKVTDTASGRTGYMMLQYLTIAG